MHSPSTMSLYIPLIFTLKVLEHEQSWGLVDTYLGFKDSEEQSCWHRVEDVFHWPFRGNFNDWNRSKPCRNHKTRRIESGVKRRHRSGIRDGKITYLRECWGNRSNLVNAAFFTFYTWPRSISFFHVHADR